MGKTLYLPNQYTRLHRVKKITDMIEWWINVQTFFYQKNKINTFQQKKSDEKKFYNKNNKEKNLQKPILQFITTHFQFNVLSKQIHL